MKKIAYLLTLALLWVAPLAAAQAITCQMEFRAKRTVEESRWFGTVPRPEFKSGIVSGEGVNLKTCQYDALATIRREGWEITYQRLLRSSGRQDRSRLERPENSERFNRYDR